MASVNVTIRMDADDKVKAEKLFSELGLTMNAAFNMFIKTKTKIFFDVRFIKSNNFIS